MNRDPARSKLAFGISSGWEIDMSNPMDDSDQDRPTVVGTDPDMNIGDEDPAASERAEDDDQDDDRVDVEDLP